MSAKFASTCGRKSRLMKSANVGTGALSRIPTSPLASPAFRAASICSAIRLLVCFVLSRNCSPLNVNLNHQFFDPFYSL